MRVTSVMLRSPACVRFEMEDRPSGPGDHYRYHAQSKLFVNLQPQSDVMLAHSTLMEAKMETKIDATVSRKRDVNMFAVLSHGNWSILDRAKEKRDGYHYELMSCLMFAAFKHEAFINHLGYKLIPNWNCLLYTSDAADE